MILEERGGNLVVVFSSLLLVEHAEVVVAGIGQVQGSLMLLYLFGFCLTMHGMELIEILASTWFFHRANNLFLILVVGYIVHMHSFHATCSTYFYLSHNLFLCGIGVIDHVMYP